MQCNVSPFTTCFSKTASNRFDSVERNDLKCSCRARYDRARLFCPIHNKYTYTFSICTIHQNGTLSHLHACVRSLTKTVFSTMIWNTEPKKLQQWPYVVLRTQNNYFRIFSLSPMAFGLFSSFAIACYTRIKLEHKHENAFFSWVSSCCRLPFHQHVYFHTHTLRKRRKNHHAFTMRTIIMEQTSWEAILSWCKLFLFSLLHKICQVRRRKGATHSSYCNASRARTHSSVRGVGIVCNDRRISAHSKWILETWQLNVIT